MLEMYSYCNTHWIDTTDNGGQRMLEESVQEESKKPQDLRVIPSHFQKGFLSLSLQHKLLCSPSTVGTRDVCRQTQ